MQVKKFEAKTMKDALQLVKQELGPEAIILSAKDNKKSFGLAGKGSVEITAAISERSLQKKKYTESQMLDDTREKFRTQSARKQKELIEETVAKFMNRSQSSKAAAASKTGMRRRSLNDVASGTGAVARRPVTSQRYIEISDEEPTAQMPEKSMNGRRVDDILEEFARRDGFAMQEKKAKSAAKAAFAAQTQSQTQPQPPPATPVAPAATLANQEVASLRKEVESLRKLLNQFNQQEKPATRHPGAEYGLPFEFAANFERLQNAGVDTRYIVEILEKANTELTPMEKKKGSMVDAWVARYILSHTSVVGHWFRPGTTPAAHLFVGPGGHGKTSALVKIASQLALQERKKVAVISCDTFKVGATDQLKIYCQILNLPFETVSTTSEFPKLMQRFAGYDAVLVDYPGFSLKDMQEIDQIRSLMPNREIPKQTHLVLSCASKDLDAYEICHRYQVTHFDDILVTKLDESFVHGFLYNIQRKTEKSLYAFGIGSKIPEDIELATRERVVDLIFKITKNAK